MYLLLPRLSMKSDSTAPINYDQNTSQFGHCIGNEISTMLNSVLLNPGLVIYCWPSPAQSLFISGSEGRVRRLWLKHDNPYSCSFYILNTLFENNDFKITDINLKMPEKFVIITAWLQTNIKICYCYFLNEERSIVLCLLTAAPGRTERITSKCPQHRICHMFRLHLRGHW
jgi:hypothetical protein